MSKLVKRSTMEVSRINIDSGILQFAPTGSYYEGQNQQYKVANKMWQTLFDFDRSLFCLVSLLSGTGFSKGAISHMLLSNPMSTDPRGRDIIPEGLDGTFEEHVIMHNLRKEKTPRALKNLLLLVGDKQHGLKRVNNKRTKRIILNFIFDRESKDLEYLAVNYKRKLHQLIRHALGKQDLKKVLEGDSDRLGRLAGTFIETRSYKYQIFLHIFNKSISKTGYFLPLIEKYYNAREAAKTRNLALFLTVSKGLPYRTVMGFRNTYKLDIPIKSIMAKATMGSKEKMQMESAAKKHGTKIKKVNYMNQDLYDLWKAFYFKLENNEPENMDKISEAITHQAGNLEKIDFGPCVVIVDASYSMIGSDKRRLHPFLTALSIVSMIDHKMDVQYVGGEVIDTNLDSPPLAIFPSGATALWKGLCQAVSLNPETIVVISDGYENAVAGTFNKVYEHFRKTEFDFKLLHINPVMAADARKGTVRKIAHDVVPLPVADYKYLETEVIFNQMLENRQMVKRLLIGKYRKMIGGE